MAPLDLWSWRLEVRCSELPGIRVALGAHHYCRKKQFLKNRGGPKGNATIDGEGLGWQLWGVLWVWDREQLALTGTSSLQFGKLDLAP